MENLFDQGKVDQAWDRMKAYEKESRGEIYDFERVFWEPRMDLLRARILLYRNELNQAKTVIIKKLERARKKHMRKREGGFLCLLGEAQLRQGQPDNAIKNLSEAIAILKEVGNPRQLWQAHTSLAWSYNKMGRSSEAKEQWGAAAGVIHNLANGLSDRQLKEGFVRADPILKILSKAEN
jgi:tetratricopeptide (TPR) repeat protein